MSLVWQSVSLKVLIFQVFSKRTDSHDQSADWSRNDRIGVCQHIEIAPLHTARLFSFSFFLFPKRGYICLDHIYRTLNADAAVNAEVVVFAFPPYLIRVVLIIA